MYKTTKYAVNIDIKLNNGVYMFENLSSTGKSYLYKLLKRMAVAGEPVMAYSYSDYILGIGTDIIKPKTQKLLLIDRYDLFKDKLNTIIEDFAKYGIVLIDCKSNIKLDSELVAIRLTNSLIEVVE